MADITRKPTGPEKSPPKAKAGTVHVRMRSNFANPDMALLAKEVYALPEALATQLCDADAADELTVAEIADLSRKDVQVPRISDHKE